MPPDYNHTTQAGRLTRDPELRHVGQSCVAGFTLAVGNKYKTKSGEQREETLFIDCEAWGKPAEIITQYVKKGDPLLVDGRLKMDQWEDREGNKRSKIKLAVANFQFLSSGQSKGEPRQSAPAPSARGDHPGDSPIDPDDIPF